MAKRKKFSAQTKIQILKKHLQKNKAISELCTEHECAPGSIYQWQETLFSRGHQLFENKTGRPVDSRKADARLTEVEKKLAAKNAIIAELMEELLKEKKLNGVI